MDTFEFSHRWKPGRLDGEASLEGDHCEGLAETPAAVAPLEKAVGVTLSLQTRQKGEGL